MTMDGVTHDIGKWDLLIAHPPCTYLSNAGARFLYPKGVLNEQRLRKGLMAKDFFLQFLWADIPKIAVMPQNRKDVLTLLAATEEMATNYADRPIITMSMAGTGVISRLCGEVFGSSMTFGAAKKASAPGQMGVNDLSTVLDLLHKAM